MARKKPGTGTRFDLRLILLKFYRERCLIECLVRTWSFMFSEVDEGDSYGIYKQN